MKRMIYRPILFLLFLIFVSCNLLADNIPPYIIDGEMVLDASSKYEAAGLDFVFLNKSEKAIKQFTLVFYMYDEYGNPPGTGRNNIVVTVTSAVKAGEKLSGCINLDSYISEIPEIPYTIDFLYVSKIVYEDDSIWSDPFGLCVF